MIERYKGIAGYISDKTGVILSDAHLRRLASRDEDPLPVRKFLGRVIATERDLDAWIERQWRSLGGVSARSGTP